MHTKQEIEAVGFLPTLAEYFTAKAWLRNYVFQMKIQMHILGK